MSLPEISDSDKIRNALNLLSLLSGSWYCSCLLTCFYLRYSRGLDRIDGELLLKSVWPGGIIDYGEPKAINEFVEFITPLLSRLGPGQHQIHQSLIQFVSPSEAKVETYFTSLGRMPTEDGDMDQEINGRYFDYFEKRGDEWRIKERHLFQDFIRARTQS